MIPYLSLGAVPLLAVLLYITRLFYRLRKKRGYRFLTVGSAILLLSALLEITISTTALQQPMLPVFLHHLVQALFNIGWYVSGIALFMLNRNLAKRGRIVLLCVLPVILIISFMPAYISMFICGLAAIFVAVQISKWLPEANSGFRWLLILFALSELYGGIEQLLPKSLNLHYAVLVHDSFFIVGCSMVLVLVTTRISDVLENSYKSSITDGLTGLFNRKYFMSAVQKYVERASDVAIIFFDLDNFKKVNDTQGHKAGDDALKIVASILKEEIEGRGIAGRFGGEEMVVLVTSNETVLLIEEFSERVRKRIEKECVTTASIGFARYSKGLPADELLKRADEAMYFSKSNGKNRVTGFMVA
ncbi:MULTISPECIES: GGDEF domain-containing protein [unclassified Paenibacillus]|uniref:GGDEF domain-containing protein n=1 Tax=unclassified Paenibacillus TaxID=185978 RepID=UPI002783881B|nr:MULTISPECIES: GGDEF domain-containing protein [unclassified Paenibacillus]MDQ0896222.1 two-component system cell cycle response regulator [Paenibacillus sp. V4I7]MDQ0913962.1 two-component system cell cycle response regulator [Paenibacillus sp. V4I5]